MIVLLASSFTTDSAEQEVGLPLLGSDVVPNCIPGVGRTYDLKIIRRAMAANSRLIGHKKIRPWRRI